jgi:ArsR family transcriptional regulator
MARKGAYCDCNVIHEDIVERVKDIMPSEKFFVSATDFFMTFSDISRVKILWALSKDELCVCDIASLLNMTKSAISHKLKYLKLKNMVDFRKEGRMAYYFLSDAFPKELFEEIIPSIIPEFSADNGKRK